MTDRFAAASPSERSPAPTAMAFVSDSETEELVRRALGDLNIDDAYVSKGGVETATAELGRRKSPRLLIVDISGVENPLVRINELAEKCEPEVNVVTIGDKNDILLYQDMKTAGVSEYFFKPLVRDSLKRVCNRLLNGVADERPATAATGKLVFVLGVRGGVGATTIAVNAAMRLAEKGQRWVMLVDLDLQGGDAALQLAATPTNALHEALERPERVDKLFLERGALHAGERFDLLASLEPLGRGVPLRDDTVMPLIDKLLQRYRFVFVDLPAAAAASLVQALHTPSACVLVSNASLASARDLVRWRDWIGPNTSGTAHPARPEHERRGRGPPGSRVRSRRRPCARRRHSVRPGHCGGCKPRRKGGAKKLRAQSRPGRVAARPGRRDNGKAAFDPPANLRLSHDFRTEAKPGCARGGDAARDAVRLDNRRRRGAVVCRRKARGGEGLHPRSSLHAGRTARRGPDQQTGIDGIRHQAGGEDRQRAKDPAQR